MYVGLNDADLAPRIAKGDREAEAELCRRMGPRIQLYGLRHLRSPSAADDLVQQVLLKVLEALRATRLREPEKLAHFVLGTCRMTVMDLRRTGRRQKDLLTMFGRDLVPDSHRTAASARRPWRPRSNRRPDRSRLPSGW